ncbi:MAG: hypothetical protein LAN37_04325 [Acidobacteriia bacterium]|nr:hypothetical protein [Terriglobia bacterium]
MRIILLIACLATAIAGSAQTKVPPKVVRRLEPTLAALKKPHVDPECRGVDYTGRCADMFRAYEERLYDLFKDKTATGDESVAVLFSFYIGEHPGEELLCEAAGRGRPMIPLLKKYRTCSPDILSRYPRSMHLEQNICRENIDRAIDLIRTDKVKKQCDFD